MQHLGAKRLAFDFPRNEVFEQGGDGTCGGSPFHPSELPALVADGMARQTHPVAIAKEYAAVAVRDDDRGAERSLQSSEHCPRVLLARDNRSELDARH